MKLADVLKDAFIRAGVELPKKLKYKKKQQNINGIKLIRQSTAL